MSPQRPVPTSRTRQSDTALLRAVADGDLSALGQLYDRHARDVWVAVSRTLGGSADVDDVVHMVFLNLPRIAPSYDGRENARPWLAGIGVRHALRHRRSAGRFLKMLASLAHTLNGPAPATPERQAGDRAELRLFELALARLSPKKRAVFTLVEFDGLTTEEVARVLEIPAATVRTRLHHARRALHDAMKAERDP